MKYLLLNDSTGEDVVGGALSEDNAYVSSYGALLPGEKRPNALAVGESTRKTYALSGARPTVYRLTRVE